MSFFIVKANFVAVGITILFELQKSRHFMYSDDYSNFLIHNQIFFIDSMSRYHVQEPLLHLSNKFGL